jgi:hypothetical protein
MIRSVVKGIIDRGRVRLGMVVSEYEIVMHKSNVFYDKSFDMSVN